jgi:hypothetical protein
MRRGDDKEGTSVRIDELMEHKNDGNRAPTMFDVALNPDREKGQYVSTREEMGDDALLMFMAGTDTTLSQWSWEALVNPDVHKRLREELLEHMPSTKITIPPLTRKTLPYLVRVSFAGGESAFWLADKRSEVSSASLSDQLRRAGQIDSPDARDGSAIWRAAHTTWCESSPIPSSYGGARTDEAPPYHQTAVSHCTYVYHADNSIFKDADAFMPERWFGDDFAELDNHMISFSRGSRSCLGIKYVLSLIAVSAWKRWVLFAFADLALSSWLNSLAYSVLYLAVSQIVRRFDFTPFETTQVTMEWKDLFMPKTRGHLRVTLKEIEEWRERCTERNGLIGSARSRIAREATCADWLLWALILPGGVNLHDPSKWAV